MSIWGKVVGGAAGFALGGPLGALLGGLAGHAVDKMRESMGEERVAAREEKVKRVYPLRRIGEMEDVSNAVPYLASDRGRHVTGQVLSVNGGFAMV